MAKVLVHKNRLNTTAVGECDHCGKKTCYLRSASKCLDPVKARCSYCGETFDLEPDAEAVRLL